MKKFTEFCEKYFAHLILLMIIACQASYIRTAASYHEYKIGQSRSLTLKYKMRVDELEGRIVRYDLMGPGPVNENWISDFEHE